jgi:hypothetical protein
VREFWAAVWANLKAGAKWFALKLGAPGAALLIVIGAVILVALGFKELQIGGILGKLLGRKDPDGPKVIDVVNSIPEGRVDGNGNLIPLGQPDKGGNTQVQVVPIDQPGLFSNPDHVTYTPPGAVEPVVVKLPEGVKAKDVDQVVVVKPDVVVVTVKDSSGVTPGQVDDLLKRYGG